MHATGLSVTAGVAVVFLGVVVLIAAAIQHFTLIRELSTDTWRPGRVSRNAVILAVLLAVIGAAMTVYLLILG